MTQSDDSFRLAPSARLLTPKAPGAATLWDAVERQASLKASPLSDTPLTVMPRNPQRVYCESSGSTGPAKMIRRTPASWIASFEVTQQRFHIAPHDIYAVLGHLGHSLTLYAALEAMHLGAGLAFLSDLSPKQQAAALRRCKVTTLYATPTQLSLISRADRDLFPTVSRILVGGGKLNATLREDLSHRFPAAEMVEFFGASETSFITWSDDKTPAGSVGRAYPGVTVRIGHGRTPNEAGEIWIKSPYLFEGYDTGDSALTHWQNGFVSIGEMGRIDASGNLFLCGRRSRMVTVADQNVFPEAIEEVLSNQPGVEAAAVIAPTDALRGHIIVAAVVGHASAAELRSICRDALGDAAVPRTIWTMSELPMLPAGKPDLRHLEALWHEGKE